MPKPSLHTFRLVIGLAAVAFLASACATTSPPMRFFLLSPIEDAAPTAATLGETLVVVGPLQLPGYLDRPELVVRQPDGQFSLRELDRWGEPLDALLTNTVTANLVRLTGSSRVAAFPLPGRASADRRIIGRVLRFDADASGLATLEVQWSILDASGEPRMPVRIDAYRAQAPGTDTAALVAALSDVLGQFSRQLAGELLATGPGARAVPDDAS
jgi:uncharacterized lipoprotein YmbA